MIDERTAQPIEHEQVIPPDLKQPGAGMIVVVVLVFIFLMAAMFFIGFVPNQKRAQEVRADAAERENQSPTVLVTKPAPQPVSGDIQLPCDIRPVQQTSIFSRTNGYLKKLYVDINDNVKEGQLLAEIDTPDVAAQLAQSRAGLVQARATLGKTQSDLDLAQKTYDRYANLPAGVASDQDLDVKKSALENTKATLEQVKAAIAVAEADVQRLTVLEGFSKITAPFAGKITVRNYDVGSLVSASSSGAGKPLFEISQVDPLQVEINVPQTYSTQIDEKASVELEVRNFPGRRFAGKVARVSGALNANTRTMLVQLLFPNTDGKLLPGMYGQVRLKFASDKPLLTIPVGAMIFNATGTQVAVVQDGKAHFQTVQFGRDFGTEIEVLSGLDAQSIVITNPSMQLSDGLGVKSVPMKAPEATKPAEPTTKPAQEKK